MKKKESYLLQKGGQPKILAILFQQKKKEIKFQLLNIQKKQCDPFQTSGGTHCATNMCVPLKF